MTLVNDSWDGARGHPVLTIVGLFAGAFLIVGVADYIVWGGDNPYVSLVAALGSGLLVALLGWRAMRGRSGS